MWHQICQQGIHRFFFKVAIVLSVFWLTSFLSHMYNLASFENKALETKLLANAEIQFYNSKESLTSAEDLKLKQANARLEASKVALKTNESILELIESIKDFCWVIAPSCAVFGLIFWVFSLFSALSTLEKESKDTSTLKKHPMYTNKCT